MEKALQLKPGSKIFDLPCGHGRHSVELAKRGYKVVGQDLNGWFLKVAKQVAKKEKVKIDFIQQDMRRVDFRNEFDAALNLYTSFGYFDDWHHDELVLNNIAGALKKGGLFLIDIINRERILKEFKPRRWENVDDNLILYELKHDLLTGCNYDKRTRIYPDGRREEFYSRCAHVFHNRIRKNDGPRRF